METPIAVINNVPENDNNRNPNIEGVKHKNISLEVLNRSTIIPEIIIEIIEDMVKIGNRDTISK